jgi:maleylacetate reductase
MRFVHDAAGARVVFGTGTRHDAPRELAALGLRPLLVADSVAADIVDRLRGEAVAVVDEVRPHVPAEDAAAARRLAADAGADCIVTVGGGSSVGLAKAVALTEALPILAIPTTYAGSEATPVWGITERNVKTTGRAAQVAPRVIVYDPELTYGLPASLTASSGLNAVAHCVDALWAPGRSPLSDLMAERGIERLARWLPRAVERGADREARAEVLAGAWLAGTAFGVAGSSVHHKLCHALGGRHDLPHAQTHAVMLPWTAQLAVGHDARAGAAIARAAHRDDPVEGLRDLAQRLGAPSTLAELGLAREEAVALADDIDPSMLATPFDVTRDDLRQLMLSAWGD